MNSRPKAPKSEPRSRPTVELPAEIVAFILQGRVGLSTYIAARQVCKTWASACLDDELLVSAAEYTGVVTRAQLRGLLHLSQWQATSIPHTVQFNAHGHLDIYKEVDFTRALTTMGGIATIADRPPYSRWSHDDNLWWEYGQDVWPTDRRAAVRGESLRPHEHEELLRRFKVWTGRQTGCTKARVDPPA